MNKQEAEASVYSVPGYSFFLDNLGNSPGSWLIIPTYTKECDQSFVGFELQWLTE